MAASGVSVKDDVVTEYTQLKINRKYKYIQFKINDENTTIVIDKTFVGRATTVEEETACFEEFVQQLPPNQCRYIVYDYHFETENSGSRDQLIFIVWCPENASPKFKMLYTSSKGALRKTLQGINNEIQATEVSELNQKDVLEKILSKMVK